MTARVCETCEEPVEYVQPERGDYISLGRFVHLNVALGHDAKPQCHKCGSFNYAFYQTNWGHGWRCGDCGYDFYYSLGD